MSTKIKLALKRERHRRT